MKPRISLNRMVISGAFRRRASAAWILRQPFHHRRRQILRIECAADILALWRSVRRRSRAAATMIDAEHRNARQERIEHQMRVCKREPRYRDRRGDDDEMPRSAPSTGRPKAPPQGGAKSVSHWAALQTTSAPGAQSGRVRNLAGEDV